jgi:hypothetical protein
VGDGVFAQLRHGVRTARGTPFVVPLFLVVAMAELTYGAQTVQLVVYGERALDLGPGGYGYLLSALGLGGVTSVVVNARLAASTKVSTVVIVAGSLFCATQIVYAGTEIVAFALAATFLGGAGMVTCEVVVETALARVAPSDVLGRVMGVYDGLSVAAMVAGAVLAPVLLAATSLRTSLAVLGSLTLLTVILSMRGLRGLDALSRRRTEVLASRMAVLEQLPIAAGLPAFVLEQLAAAAQMCPLPPGVDVVVEGAPAHAFYAVVDGSVVVHRNGEEVARVGPGGFFGERGLLDRSPRNASVTTSAQTTLLRLDGDVLLDALQAAPTLLSALDHAAGPGRPVSLRAENTEVVDDPTWVVA